MSRWTGEQTARPRAGRDPADGPAERDDVDWPESVRVVGLQPSLWSVELQAPTPPDRPAAVVRLGPEVLVGGGEVGEIALSREIGQSFYLMGLMALALFAFVGLGMLLVRVLA